MISKKEVEHIAKLARLGLNEKEVEKMQRELSSILDYMEKLKEIDVSEVEPTSHPLLVENVMRDDEPKNTNSGVRRKIVKQAPDSKNNYFKVKSIF